MTLDAAFAEEQFAYLTTTGRVTGKPHEIEIWFALQGNAAYLMNGDSRHKAGMGDWVRNLQKQPAVKFKIAGRSFDANARMVTEADEDRLARGLLVTKYSTSQDQLETWGRVAVPVALDLQI